MFIRRTLSTKRRVPALLLLSVVALCRASASPAEEAQTFHFEIPAEPLSVALRSFAQISGQEIVYTESIVAHKTVHSLTGDFTAQDALEKLLEGTGLSATRSPTGALMIREQEAQSLSPSSGAGDADGARSVAEVIVTAQKRKENLANVPVPVTAIAGNALADRDQVLLRDYYNRFPGLSVAPNLENQQMVSIRGVTTGGSSIPTVAITIDDAPYGGSTNSGTGNNAPDIDPGDLANVEVLRGPQGTLYGANAMGGLIKYVTKDPSTAGFSGQISAGVDTVANGAEPGYSLRGAVNVPISDTLAMRVSGFARQDAGYINNPLLGRRGVNEDNAAGGRLLMLWKPSDAVSLKVSAFYQQINGDGLNEIDRPTPGFPNTNGLAGLQQNYPAGVDQYTTINEAYSAALNVKLPEGVTLTSITGYSINRGISPFDFGFVYSSQFAPLYGVTGAPWITLIDLHKFTEELRLAGSMGSHVDWLIGGYYNDERTPTDHQDLYAVNQNTGALVAHYIHRSNPTFFKEDAAFGNLTLRLNEKFDVQVGLRQSYTSETDGSIVTNYVPTPTTSGLTLSTSGSALTYLFSPEYHFDQNVMVYARLASGYRPGGPNAFAVGVPTSFAPDKTSNYEVGVKGEFLEHKLFVDASLYYIDWSNVQVTLFDQTQSSYGSNGGSAKSEGVEFSFQARPNHWLTLSGWIDYDNAVLTQNFAGCSAATGTCLSINGTPASSAFGLSGDRLPNTPRFSGEFAAEQRFPITDEATGFVGAVVDYTGERIGLFTTSPTRQTYPGYTKVDLQAGARFAGGWSAAVYVNNVGDIRGLISGGIGYVLPYAFAVTQPRTIGLNLVKTF